jgi:dTDP-4-dehydrorhamnose reductase
MRVVVTGANGLVGSRLCAKLVQRMHQVLGISRSTVWQPHPTLRPGEGRFEYHPADLAQPEAAREAIDRWQPEAILNTASMTDVDACERNPDQAFAANVTAAGNVARAAHRMGAHLIQVSTDYVFDGEAGPYGEEDLPNPRGVYALTKHMGEQAVRVLSSSWAIARTAVVYGWPQANRPNFGAWLVRALEKKQPVQLFEDQLVSPSLADSVAAMLAELTERRLTGIWNICGSTIVDRLSFGHALCKVFGFDAALCIPSKLKEARLASPRPMRCGLRTEKAFQILAEKPLPLSESLARFYADYQRDRV